jgi:single-stranded-DNA-specific exonuclease
VRFGGHAAAAGVTILPENVTAFRQVFTAAVRERLGEPPFVPVLRPDLEVPPSAWSLELALAIERLAPFGQENPEPLLVARGVPIKARRNVGTDHLKLSLGEDGHEAIAFGMGKLLEQLPEAVDLAFRLERNVWNGRERLQLRVEDVRPA